MAKKAKKVKEAKPPVQNDEYSVVMTNDEVSAIIQILGFSKEVFEQMALNALKDKDETTSKIYSARSQLSLMLYSKFKDILKIGEPTSREIH